MLKTAFRATAMWIHSRDATKASCLYLKLHETLRFKLNTLQLVRRKRVPWVKNMTAKSQNIAVLASSPSLTTAIGFQLQERVTASVYVCTCACVIWADRWQGSESDERTTGSRATRLKHTHTRTRTHTQKVRIWRRAHTKAWAARLSGIWYRKPRQSSEIHTVGVELNSLEQTVSFHFVFFLWHGPVILVT